MKTVNQMRLSFPSKSRNEAFARSAVSSFVTSLDPTLNELNDLKTAVSEAVTNCIVHGYRRQSGTIYIYASVKEDNTVTVIDTYENDITCKTQVNSLLDKLGLPRP